MNNDPRPEYQADNAAQAQPNSQDPAVHNNAPNYGSFGTAEGAAQAAAQRNASAQNDGSNDNPDEFSEFRGKNASATEQYCLPGAIADPNLQRGHVEQNQHPEAIAAAEGGSDAEERAAYALDDPRYAGGDVFDLKDEQTGF